jgi:hypothetical protein
MMIRGHGDGGSRIKNLLRDTKNGAVEGTAAMGKKGDIPPL